MAPSERDGTSASPVIAPTRSPGRMPSLRPCPDEQPDTLAVAIPSGCVPLLKISIALREPLATLVLHLSPAPSATGAEGDVGISRSSFPPSASCAIFTAAAAMSTGIELVRQRFDHDSHVVEIGGDEPLAERRPRQLQTPGPKVGDGRHLADVQLRLS